MEAEQKIGQPVMEIMRGYPKVTKKKWGDWLFKDNLTLVHAAYKSYEVDLEKMCREEMLDWIYQLSGKNHIAPRDLGYFVYACKDIFDRESRYTTDPKKLFKINEEYMKNSHNGKE